MRNSSGLKSNDKPGKHSCKYCSCYSSLGFKLHIRQYSSCTEIADGDEKYLTDSSTLVECFTLKAGHSKNNSEYSKLKIEYSSAEFEYSTLKVKHSKNKSEYSKLNSEYSSTKFEYSKNKSEHSKTKIDYSSTEFEYSKSKIKHSELKIEHSSPGDEHSKTGSVTSKPEDQDVST